MKPGYVLPWKVVKYKCLRAQFGGKPIFEIHDANDDTVLPWGAFDHIDTTAGKQRLADLIVRLANAA